MVAKKSEIGGSFLNAFVHEIGVKGLRIFLVKNAFIGGILWMRWPWGG
jgi:hypothetical protein